VGVTAAIAFAVAVVRVGIEVLRQIRGTAAASRFRHEVGAARGEVVVAALGEPEALALSSGVIVLTLDVIRTLRPDERRAVLAHERAHLQHGHHRYRRAAALLAVSNPLLRRLPATIGDLTERWADEEAASATSRATTAAALQRVAQLVDHQELDQSPATMHSAAIGVFDRILALESDPHEANWYGLVAAAVLVAATVVVAVMTAERTIDIFELAGALGNVARRH
jgi:Zn-dependent protease with chaperone function